MGEAVVDANVINNAARNEDTPMNNDPFMAKLFGMQTQGSSVRSSFQHRQELDEYLARPIEVRHDDDPLQWWKHHHAQFPVLSKVAQDYLAIPGLLICNSSCVIYIFSHILRSCKEAQVLLSSVFSLEGNTSSLL